MMMLDEPTQKDRLNAFTALGDSIPLMPKENRANPQIVLQNRLIFLTENYRKSCSANTSADARETGRKAYDEGIQLLQALSPALASSLQKMLDVSHDQTGDEFRRLASVAAVAADGLAKQLSNDIGGQSQPRATVQRAPGTSSSETGKKHSAQNTGNNNGSGPDAKRQRGMQP
jgi:hypothetical protein